MAWTCPRCDRAFATRRAHTCEPGLPIDYWLAERPDGQREAAAAVIELARGIADVTVEAVNVGVLIKKQRSIVELRPKTKWLQLSVIARRPLPASARASVSRVVVWGKDMTAYFVRLTAAADVDRAMRAWLRDALR
ncbi:MAG: DUF5655 domain-containing protein [Kofleriaceae bacterium]